MRLLISSFIRRLHLAFKSGQPVFIEYLQKKVVSFIRNTLVNLKPEWVVTLNRNQVVSLSEISKEALELNQIITKLSDELEVVEYRFAIGKIEDTLYQKVKNKLSLEIANLDKDFNRLNRSLSNLNYYIDTSLKLCSNLSLLWSKGTLSIKQRLQNLLFPTGIFFNKDLWNYRTSEINATFQLITSISGSLKLGLTGQIGSKTDLSCMVVPTRIELISRV